MKALYTFCTLMGISLITNAQTAFLTEKDKKEKPEKKEAIRIKREPRFYLNIHSGYGTSIGSTYSYFPDNITAVSVQQIENGAPTKKTTYKEGNTGLGGGFRMGGGLSYILNDFINIGVDVDYFKSDISKTKDSLSYTAKTTDGMLVENWFMNRSSMSYSASILMFTPNVTFKAISRPRWFLYNKIGATIATRLHVTQTERQVDTMRKGWQGFIKDSVSVINKGYEFKVNSPAWGFTASLGAQIKLSEMTRCFAEVQFAQVMFFPEKRTTTSYTVNGKDVLPTMPVVMKEVQFEKQYTDDGNIDPTQPFKSVRQKVPITYLGFQLGLAYRF